MKKLPIYLSLLFILTCAKEDSQAPNTPPTQIVNQYTLTASAGDGGSVTGGGTYASGTQVSLTATPTSGYSFTGWSNGSTTNPLTVTLNTNTTITANFQVIVNNYTLTVSAGEGGSVSTEGGEYEEGTEVTVRATPDEGYKFVSWSDGSTTNPLTYTLNSNTSISANFQINTYTLTLITGEGGAVSEFNEEYEYGEELTISAIPNQGYFFQKWSGDVNSYQNQVTLTFNENKTIQAFFFEANNCINGTFEDVFNGIDIQTVNTEGNKPYNCLITTSESGHPVYSGSQSARFELQPEEGDCGFSDGFSDCDTDRSRHEISEKWIPEYENIIGKKLTYEYSMYIPEVEYFSPHNTESNNPLTVISQIFSKSEGENTIDDDINTSSCDPKALLYFVMEENKLKYLTHKPFTWNQNEKILIKDNPYNQWIKIKIEINASTDQSGYIKLFINDELVNTDNRPTLCSTGNTSFDLKLGIYNSFLSQKNKPFLKQVIYYDDVRRTIIN